MINFVEDSIFPNNHYSVAEQTMRDTGRPMKNLEDNYTKEFSIVYEPMSTQDNNTVEAKQ